MSLVYGLCMLDFKHIFRGKKFDDLQNVYISADISNLFVRAGVIDKSLLVYWLGA